MSWVDIVIIIWVVVAAVRGRSLGALVQIFGFVGFVVGLGIGSLLAVPVASKLSASPLRSLLTVVFVLGLAVAAGMGGRVLGKWANVTMRRLHLGTVDAIAGAVLAALGAILSAWLVAGLFAQSSVSWVSAAIQRSAVLTSLDVIMPPVPSLLARAQVLLSDEWFPVAFASVSQPTTQAVQPPPSALANQLAAPIARSVFKVVASGGCGVSREGTAFVVAPGLLATNAHVVAGERSVAIEAAGASSTPATVVRFDPSMDIALLRDPAIRARPVHLVGAIQPVGSPGAVVGFPENGPLRVLPAGIAQSFSAEGRDIYGSGLVTRPIYVLSVGVQPGSSGSPLAVGSGVAGMIFSRSIAQSNVAYAIRANALAPEVRAARGSTRAVSSGSCTPG